MLNIENPEEAKQLHETIRKIVWIAAKKICKTRTEAAYIFKDLFSHFPARDWDDLNIPMDKSLYGIACGMVTGVQTLRLKLWISNNNKPADKSTVKT